MFACRRYLPQSVCSISIWFNHIPHGVLRRDHPFPVQIEYEEFLVRKNKYTAPGAQDGPYMAT